MIGTERETRSSSRNAMACKTKGTKASILSSVYEDPKYKSESQARDGGEEREELDEPKGAGGGRVYI